MLQKFCHVILNGADWAISEQRVEISRKAGTTIYSVILHVIPGWSEAQCECVCSVGSQQIKNTQKAEKIINTENTSH